MKINRYDEIPNHSLETEKGNNYMYRNGQFAKGANGTQNATGLFQIGNKTELSFRKAQKLVKHLVLTVTSRINTC